MHGFFTDFKHHDLQTVHCKRSILKLVENWINMPNESGCMLHIIMNCPSAFWSSSGVGAPEMRHSLKRCTTSVGNWHMPNVAKPFAISTQLTQLLVQMGFEHSREKLYASTCKNYPTGTTRVALLDANHFRSTSTAVDCFYWLGTRHSHNGLSE